MYSLLIPACQNPHLHLVRRVRPPRGGGLQGPGLSGEPGHHPGAGVAQPHLGEGGRPGLVRVQGLLPGPDGGHRQRHLDPPRCAR